MRPMNGKKSIKLKSVCECGRCEQNRLRFVHFPDYHEDPQSVDDWNFPEWEKFVERVKTQISSTIFSHALGAMDAELDTVQGEVGITVGNDCFNSEIIDLIYLIDGDLDMTGGDHLSAFREEMRKAIAYINKLEKEGKFQP